MATPTQSPKRTPANSAVPDIRQEYPVSLLTGLAFAFVVFLALPISQLISDIRDDKNTVVDSIEYRPDPLFEQPPPPPDETVKDDIEDIKEDREPPTLEQLELSMSADLSSFASSDFSMPSFDFGSQLEDMIFELEDLTRVPRPIRRVAPTYPPELRRARIEGTVYLMFVVRIDGTTSNIVATQSDNPLFEEAAIRAVRRWEFEPGEKDGKAVQTRVRLPIPFTIN
jgi:periplasmic protein TonB